MNYVLDRKILQCVEAHDGAMDADIIVSEAFEETSFIIRIKDLFSGSVDLSVLVTTDTTLSFLPLLIYQEEKELLLIGLQNRALFIDTRRKIVLQDVNFSFILFFIYNVKENNSFLLVTECEILSYNGNGELLHSFCTNDIIIDSVVIDNQLHLKTESKSFVINPITWQITPSNCDACSESTKP